MHLIAVSILRYLFANEAATASIQESRNYSLFLQCYYEHYATLLLPPILTKANTAEQVLGLLSELCEKHGTNLQFLLLKNNLFPAILDLLNSPCRTLQLGRIA